MMSSLAALAATDDPVNPLRLGYTSGSVSFLRYGAEDWVEARVNTPLVAGDALYTGDQAVFELQGEGRAFIRADQDTQVTLVNQTPDFLQLKVTTGRVSLDLRTLPSTGYTIELDTPTAVFTIDHTGYYRVDVDGDVHFITRRGGQAIMTPEGGQAMTILPSEEIVVSAGSDHARASTYVAPEPDGWDRWNYDRTADLVDAVSERYLPAGIAGASDLDHYGNWRQSSEYGQVWVPDGVSSDWAPYSSGRWIWDPYYQWTWIDDAPWGWAPFHYGRWVYLGGYWAWAPGPVVLRRPVYAPALVAFYGVGSHVSVGVSFGSGLGWIALSWGEPLVPWWGHSGFIGRPWWGGWHGPHVVNNVVVRQTTVVNITNITYANSHVSKAFVATTPEHFGRSHMRDASHRPAWQPRELEHVRGALPLKPTRMSLVADAPRSIRPPEQVLTRQVMSTRRPHEAKLPWRSEASDATAARQRYVPAPKPADTGLRRPDPGIETGPERARPPLPPRYEEWKSRTEAVSPPAGERRESGPFRVAPVESGRPERAREVAPPASINKPVSVEPPPRPTDPQRQAPRMEEPRRQPMRAVPPETRSQSWGGREVAPTPIAPERQSPRVEPAQPSRVEPSDRGSTSRWGREVTPAPVRVVPERQPPSPPSRIGPADRGASSPPMRVDVQPGRAQDAQRERRPELPGEPANRTYRGGEQDKRERQR